MPDDNRNGARVAALSAADGAPQGGAGGFEKDSLRAVGSPASSGERVEIMSTFTVKPHIVRQEVDGGEDMLQIDFVAVTRQGGSVPNDKGLFVEPLGLDTSRFLKNPTLIWAHDSGIHSVSNVPIGRVSDLKVSKSKITGTALIPHFVDPIMEDVRQQIERGHLTGISIGFWIIESEPVEANRMVEEIDEETGKTRRVKRKEVIGLRVTKGRLLEISVVPQGADEDALIKKAKGVSAQLVAGANTGDDWCPPEQWHSTEGEATEDTEAFVRMTLKHADICAASLGRDASVWALSKNGEPRQARFMEPGELTDDPSTDDAAENPDDPHGNGINVTAADMQNCAFLFMKGDNPKGVHHDRHERVQLAAVMSNMSKVLGARGGYGFDGLQRQMAWAHLAQHYAEFGLACPALKEYTEDELKVLAAKGLLIIPGQKARAPAPDLSDDDAATLAALDANETETEQPESCCADDSALESRRPQEPHDAAPADDGRRTRRMARMLAAVAELNRATANMPEELAKELKAAKGPECPR